MDDSVLGLTRGTGYGIKLDLNESNDLGYSIEYSELPCAYLIQGLFIWLNIVHIIFLIMHMPINLIGWMFFLIRLGYAYSLVRFYETSSARYLQNENSLIISHTLTPLQNIWKTVSKVELLLCV